MGRPTTEGESPVTENRRLRAGILSTAGHVKPRGNMGGPPSKPKYYLMTDSGKYREGKVKSTPGGE